MLSTVLLSWVLTAATPERPLVISTLPFDSAGDQEAIFGALSSPLEQALGRAVRFEPGASYQEVVTRLNNGAVDVAFVGALAYLQARKHGAHAILKSIRKGASSYHGVLLVSAESPLKSVKDLKGKTVAFVDKTSTSGYLYPRMLLKKSGLDPDKDVTALFAGTHRQALDMVLSGKAAAGACFDGAQEALPEPGKVRVLGRTADIPSDPVVVGASVGAAQSKALRKALIDLAQNNAAAAFFAAADIDGFVPAADRDYDSLAEQAAGSF